MHVIIQLNVRILFKRERSNKYLAYNRKTKILEKCKTPTYFSTLPTLSSKHLTQLLLQLLWSVWKIRFLDSVEEKTSSLNSYLYPEYGFIKYGNEKKSHVSKSRVCGGWVRSSFQLGRVEGDIAIFPFFYTNTHAPTRDQIKTTSLIQLKFCQ